MSGVDDQTSRARIRDAVTDLAVDILTSVLTLGGIAVALSVILVFVDRTLHVDEDPRLDVVEEMLPGNNCGACGFPGCRSFSEAVVGGEVQPAKCTVSTDESKSHIAGFLGIDVGMQEKAVARLACAGGINVSRGRASYTGISTCGAAAQVGGGGKGCAWGCLGLGDCERVCDFDAIVMDEHFLPVVLEDLCTACGDCVEVCPKDLFEIHPLSHHLWVACRNLQAGEEVLEDCEVACTACGRCAVDAPAGLVTMRDNLPVVDYCGTHTTRVPIERCPTGAIVWLDEHGTTKGREANKVLRKLPRPLAAT